MKQLEYHQYVSSQDASLTALTRRRVSQVWLSYGGPSQVEF